MKLLRIPVDHYNNVLRLLELKHYTTVLSSLDYRGRTQACSYVITNALEHNTAIMSQQAVSSFMFDTFNHSG